jgi:hypothetical protein
VVGVSVVKMGGMITSGLRLSFVGAFGRADEDGL